MNLKIYYETLNFTNIW